MCMFCVGDCGRLIDILKRNNRGAFDLKYCHLYSSLLVAVCVYLAMILYVCVRVCLCLILYVFECAANAPRTRCASFPPSISQRLPKIAHLCVNPR